MDCQVSKYFFITAVTCILVYFYFRYKLSYWKRRGVKQLHDTNMVFGDFKKGLLFRTSPAYHLGEIYRKAPQDALVVGFYIFHKPCILLRDPEIIKHVLIRDFDNFSDRCFAGLPQRDSFGMKNLFGLKNPAWRYLRRKIAPTLTRSKLKQMVPFMMETGQPMMEFLQKETLNYREGKVIDAQDVNYKYSADLIANVALGTKTDSFKNPNSDYCKCVMNFFQGFKRMVALLCVFFMPEVVEVIGSPILFDSTFFRKIFWCAIEMREKSGNIRGDYIDSIIQLKNGTQNSLYKFEGDNLFYQSGSFFSGFESSSATSAYTLMELARTKEYQDRAREDIKKAIDKHGWNIEAFNDMKYLDKCIAECVRLYPPIPSIDRYTLQDCKIPGTDVVIEKGTPIYISVHGLHVDPKYFDEPEIFNPDRFTDNKKMSDAYIPFGAGPRMCIGSEIGRMHAKVVLSMILSEYEVHQDPKEINKLDSRSIFTAAANGIPIKFKRLIE